MYTCSSLANFWATFDLKTPERSLSWKGRLHATTLPNKVTIHVMFKQNSSNAWLWVLLMRVEFSRSSKVFFVQTWGRNKTENLFWFTQITSCHYKHRRWIFWHISRYEFSGFHFRAAQRIFERTYVFWTRKEFFLEGYPDTRVLAYSVITWLKLHSVWIS